MMNRSLRGFAVLSFCTLLPVTQSGCLIAAAAVGTGATVAYVRGDTETVMNGTPEQVTAAGKGAVEDMKLVLISSNASGVDGKIEARTAADKRVTVIVKAAGSQTSKVSIRVGTFGDSALQQALLAKMQAKLPASTTQPAIASAPATQPLGSAR